MLNQHHRGCGVGNGLYRNSIGYPAGSRLRECARECCLIRTTDESREQGAARSWWAAIFATSAALREYPLSGVSTTSASLRVSIPLPTTSETGEIGFLPSKRD